MRAAWQLAINSLAGRRGRSAMLVLAVLLATSLVVAAAASLSTVSKSLSHVMGAIVGLSDVTIQNRYGAPMQASVVDQVRQWEGVEEATARFNIGVVVRDPEDADRFSTVSAVGIDPVRDAQVQPRTILAGQMLDGPGQLMLDQHVAEKTGLGVGDEAWLVTYDEPEPVTVVGIFERPHLAVLQKPEVLVTLDQAYRMAGLDGIVHKILVQVDTEIDAEAWQARYANEIPAELEIRTAAGREAGIRHAIMAAQLLLSITTLLVYLSASFLILTTLTTAVTEQQRELAILRCIGASRSQVAGAQLIAGVALSLSGAIAGVPIGILLAWLMYHRFESLLQGGFTVGILGVSIAIGGAIVAGLIGAGYPAALAARVSPIEALAARANNTSTRALLACLVFGLLLVMVEPICLMLPIDVTAAFWFYATTGLPLTLVGYFLLGVPVLVGLAYVLGPLVGAILRLPHPLLRQNVLSKPMRNGFTGGALMVSLGLFIAMWTDGRSIMSGWFGEMKMPDAFVHSYYSLTPRQAATLENVDGVTRVCATTMFPVRVRDMQFGIEKVSPGFTQYVSFEPDDFFAMTELTWVQGDRDTALQKLNEGNALLVSEEYLVAHGIGVGATITLDTAEGPIDFEVVGVVESIGLDVAVAFFGIQAHYAEASISSIFGSRDDAIRYFHTDAMHLMLLQVSDDITDEQLKENIQEAMPGVVAGTSRDIRQTAQASANEFMTVGSTVALASLLIACIGVANLITASITARRFEFGVLRAVGGGRWLLGRLVLGETLVVAMVGAVVGTVLGIQLSLVARAFHGRMLGIVYTPDVPWDIIMFGWAAVIGSALVAAVPAIAALMTQHPLHLLQSGRGD